MKQPPTQVLNYVELAALPSGRRGGARVEVRVTWRDCPAPTNEVLRRAFPRERWRPRVHVYACTSATRWFDDSDRVTLEYIFVLFEERLAYNLAGYGVTLLVLHSSIL